jgi:hypothetical protein
MPRRDATSHGKFTNDGVVVLQHRKVITATAAAGLFSAEISWVGFMSPGAAPQVISL